MVSGKSSKAVRNARAAVVTKRAIPWGTIAAVAVGIVPVSGQLSLKSLATAVHARVQVDEHVGDILIVGLVTVGAQLGQQHLGVVLAGPVMNLLVAVAIFACSPAASSSNAKYCSSNWSTRSRTVSLPRLRWPARARSIPARRRS